MNTKTLSKYALKSPEGYLKITVIIPHSDLLIN